MCSRRRLVLTPKQLIEHVVVTDEGDAAIRVRTVRRRPASDRWNVDAVKAMQASLRVPNFENLRQVTVKPERLTKKIDVEGDVSRSQEQVRRFQEFMFREFKLTKGILEQFGLSDSCKVVKQLRLDGRQEAHR